MKTRAASAQRFRTTVRLLSVLLPGLAVPAAAQRFVMIGDRTGGARPGVYEQVWREAAAERPDFVVSAGDTIEGLDDATADAEWREIRKVLTPYRRIPMFFAPGNHDIWSGKSAELFTRYTGRPRHYGFDRGRVHLTVLDNSRSDELPGGELAFLENDLKAHAAQPLKFIVMHRPSWFFDVLFGNTNFALHRLARKYGVQYVVAGHVHVMMHAELDGVHYVSLPSAAGHLRGSRKYEDGWFFGYALFDRGEFTIKELRAPHGKGRVGALADWGKTGLLQPKAQNVRAGSDSNVLIPVDGKRHR